MSKEAGIRKGSYFPRPGVDWEDKLVPYLNDGGATSVAVVTIFHQQFWFLWKLFVNSTHCAGILFPEESKKGVIVYFWKLYLDIVSDNCYDIL